jgi:signal transduction histidine kinase/ActR/RegA family two-component response regulator
MASQAPSPGSRPPGRGRFRYAAAAAAVAAAFGLVLTPVIGPGLVGVLLLAVMLSALYGGLGPGLFATGLVLFVGVFVVRWIGEPGFVLVFWRVARFVVFAVAGTTVSVLIEALHAARRRAEEASRAKDHVLAILSHELRTPLNPVLAEVSALLQAPGLTPEVREALEMVRRNVRLEARLIDDLLDVNRIGRGTLSVRAEPADAHALIRAVANTCRGALDEAGLRLRLELEAARPGVLADPARVQQVLWNLLRNAAKFTPPGGTVAIRTFDANDTGCLIVKVCDTGIGIPAADLGRIFLPFEQGTAHQPARPEGLGLGLAIAQGIARAHGGRLWAESDGPGRGTTFTLELPATEAVPLPAPAPEPALPAPGRRLSILLVEDDGESRRVIERLLTRRGHAVRSASTCAEALALDECEGFEVLVSDIRLPDGSGLELMRRLREVRPIAGIALSGLGAETDRARSLEAGFREHLTKPIDFPSLEAALARATVESEIGIS